ncbi:MAG TPA: aminopeptidase [Gaiella sp.]|nr:aminopeptidase [Gaiella sp.]
MTDPRNRQLAELLVDTCVGVKPGWQVLVVGSPLGRPLIEEVVRVIAERDAYALLRVTFDESTITPRSWTRIAPIERLAVPAPIEVHAMESCDALVVIVAPENTRDMADIPSERTAAIQGAYRPHLERVFRHELPWVGCQYPTPALAQEAGMSTDEFADFLYGACLRDWDAERERMQRYADRFDAAEEVRIVGYDTDIRLSIAGRTMKVDAGGANIPGGEFFGCPVEDSAEGTIAFTEFPAVYSGREMNGIRLRFEGGKVVDASAETNEDYLVETLDSDEGSRRLGELGIGCNPGITRYMRNTLFDEKIDGTVHLALGNGMPDLGGENVSRIHWDIVKDLRLPGTRIELDGDVVQQDGVWTI